ncbi:MAG: hypothetical protein U0325_05500 [Polyangiales bacterium]
MSHPLCLLRGASLAIVLTLSAAAGAQPPTPPTGGPALPAGAEVELADEPAEGTTVRRGVSRFVVQAPMAEVVRAFMDYGHYTELLPQVTTSRVVRRTRAGTEVYLQVDLGGNLGALWSRVRVTVERTPQRVTFQGTSLEGNVERFEFSARIDPVEGDPARTLLECRMLSIPQLPFPSTVFTRENRRALTMMANRVRARMSPGAPEAPVPPPSVPTTASPTASPTPPPSPAAPAARAGEPFPSAAPGPTTPSP